jgi:hypothetical protein
MAAGMAASAAWARAAGSSGTPTASVLAPPAIELDGVEYLLEDKLRDGFVGCWSRRHSEALDNHNLSRGVSSTVVWRGL